jgi:hypothetical protein
MTQTRMPLLSAPQKESKRRKEKKDVRTTRHVQIYIYR